MPDEILRALLRLVETNKGNQTSPAVSSGEERGLVSRTAAGNRAYLCAKKKKFRKACEDGSEKSMTEAMCMVKFSSQVFMMSIEKQKRKKMTETSASFVCH